MKKLVLVVMAGLLAFGIVAGAGTAQAAPPAGVRCTGSSSVWDDTDIVHLTKEGAGTLVLSWTARGHTTMNCGANSPLTGQVARIEERVRVRVMPGGAVQGQAHVRVLVGHKQHVFNGRFTGRAMVTPGSIALAGAVQDTDRDTDASDFLLLRQHGTLNPATKQWTNIYIDAVASFCRVGAAARRFRTCR
jgi:hypothetical protein